MCIPFGLELKGSLNPQALDRLVARLEVLRTCFVLACWWTGSLCSRSGPPGRAILN